MEKIVLLKEDFNKDFGISYNFGIFGIVVFDLIVSYRFEVNNDYIFFLDSYEDDIYKVFNYFIIDENLNWYNSLEVIGIGFIGDGYVEIINNIYKDFVNGIVVFGR